MAKLKLGDHGVVVTNGEHDDLEAGLGSVVIINDGDYDASDISNLITEARATVVASMSAPATRPARPDSTSQPQDTLNGETDLYIRLRDGFHATVHMSLEGMYALLVTGEPLLLTEVGGKRTIINPADVVYVNEGPIG
ncbi:MAG TPA: hypothetical protein PKV96_00180 [Candidatus Saccharimonas sp.]|jgi:hypothetical protein|nr:hypothetical protein [Candidatus Saccharimonas sp.]